MREVGSRPTLGELQRTTPWVWLWCERCQHHAPLACAIPVILWGPDASSDKLRAGARCTSCGGKGATAVLYLALGGLPVRHITDNYIDAREDLTHLSADFDWEALDKKDNLQNAKIPYKAAGLKASPLLKLADAIDNQTATPAQKKQWSEEYEEFLGGVSRPDGRHNKTARPPRQTV
jgi:hypothetical protein